MATDLARALAVAVEAAREAGDLVRAEFERPGGPRGSGGHAPVDTESETVIRGCLLAAFPGTGFQGEETGRVAATGADPEVWCVDPNDGTVAFLRGWRGSAVSIALVRGGLPVLGVVFAPTAPGPEGEMFAWAEGCGPVTRNGVPASRPPFAARLSPYHVLAVSQSADRASEQNAAAAAPARYRALPSIAWRLALVATGDCEAGVSLNSPGDWDYAAGHALVRGAGGDLWDEAGRPVRYGPDGTSRVRWCFGGGEAACRDLARRDWGAALGAPKVPADGAYDLVKLLPGRCVADGGLLARAQGSLLGQVAGDSLGALVEFRSAHDIAGEYPRGVRDLQDGGGWNLRAGQPTDDSEMALSLARSIVAAGGYDVEAAAAAYAAWYHSPAFDVGGTTRRALCAITDADLRGRTAAAAARAAANRESEANGSLMRIAPIGIWGARRTDDEVAAAARADASLTHPNPVCLDAAEAFTVALAAAIREGLSPEDTWRRALDRTRPGSAVRADLDAAAEGPPGDYLHNMGWVRTALRNAFHHLLRAPSLEEGLVATVGAGGDTDTNGAIAGALLGAVHGRDAVPARWRNLVLSCRALPGPAGLRPRPRGFWPVDALELAERLLVAGPG